MRLFFWFFRYRYELRKLRLNRTFVRLGALTGACAAFAVAAAVVHAVYCATVTPAVGPVPPCGRGRRGFLFALRRLGLRDPPPMGAAFRFAAGTGGFLRLGAPRCGSRARPDALRRRVRLAGYCAELR